MSLRLSIPRQTSLNASTLIKKHMVGVYINQSKGKDTPVWIRVSNAKEFTRSMNPVTEERDYIADEHPTTELTDYKPSEGIAVTSYKGEKDFDLFNKLYMERAIGADAHRDLLLVYLYEGQEVSEQAYYYAETCDCTVAVNEFNVSSSEISVTLYENGSATKGYVLYDDDFNPSFTKGDMPQADSAQDSAQDNDPQTPQTASAATPVFANTLQAVAYSLNDTASPLDGTATVADGGVITYKWTKADGTEVGSEALFTPPTDSAGSEIYTVTATNTLNGKTADSAQSAQVTVNA